MLGANGAGKSTLLKPLHALPTHQIVEADLALVPEGRHLFGTLSVAENLALGAFLAKAQENLETVYGIFPKLKLRQSQLSGTMSGSEQQMVAIGRAMMTCPSVLLLDESSPGLSPLLTAEMFRALPRIASSGMGILVVELNTHQSLAIADRAYLFEKGVVKGHGMASDMLQSSSVQKAYLGM